MASWLGDSVLVCRFDCGLTHLKKHQTAKHIIEHYSTTPMIHNFDEVKKQLGELSGIINGFKSEAVQLKIIELIFAGKASAEDAPQIKVQKSEEGEKKRKAHGNQTTTKSSTKSGGGTGAVATLLKVYGDGFFSQPRTIKAILDHCETNLARKIKANEISGKLARMVRSNELKREKNTDGQYEYTNKT